MAREKMRERGNTDLFQAETFFEEFRLELSGKGSVNLSEWASEVPDELRDSVIPRLLTIYLKYCQARGWTVHLADFVERFPGFQTVVELLREASRADGVLDETVSTNSLAAATRYQVADRPWKEGGQGVLHKATDTRTGGRQVVIKFLKDSAKESDFQKEIEVTAKLEHPGVVAVFARGVEEAPPQRPFYAMRLIHGQLLEEKIADFHNRFRSDTREGRTAFDPSRQDGIAPLLENIILACGTVSYAHSVGVLHCDLKPRNVVCGRFQATVVVDWGSARSHEVSQSPVGDSGPPLDLPSDTSRSYTIQYASPEQLRDADLAPTSDVYSLGATLYHALTGRSPFGDDRRPDDLPPDPRQIKPSIPRRLVAICTKAMRCSPEHRYGSVDELSKDLTNWLRDAGIAAAPDTLVEKGFRLARHHKQTAAIGLCALFALAILSLVLWNIRARELQVSHSLDSALSLIEGLCRPLENDAVQNSTEFDKRANQVRIFAETYLQENRADANLARAHELFGLVAFYRHNRAQPTEARRYLTEGLHSLEQAENIYRSTGSRLLLAQNRVRQARWLRGLAAMTSRDYDAKREVVGKLNGAIAILLGGTIAASEADDARQTLAEAYHVKGEFLHANKGSLTLDARGNIVEFGEGRASATVERNLRESLRFFTEAISILQHGEESRDLARGYGFRGDVNTSLNRFEAAIQDYRASLAIREREWEESNSDENAFQLARGLVNFGVWMRDSPREASSTQFPRETTPEMDDRVVAEVRVCETYVRRALEYQRVLAFQRGDWGDDRPMLDYRWTCNVAAELYFLGAKEHSIDTATARVYLENAGRFADEAMDGVDVRAESAGELPGNLRNILANSFMVKLQIERATGSPAETVAELAKKVNALIDVHGTGYKMLTDDQLPLHAVALAAAGRYYQLERVASEIAKRGFVRNARVKKHLACFDHEKVRDVLRVFDEAKND